MKKIIVIAVSLVSLISAFAEEKTSGWTPAISFRTVVADKYRAFGSGGMLLNKSVSQSDLFVSFQNGFYADLWNSTSLTTKWGADAGTEMDYGIGWAGKLSKLGLQGSVGELTLDLGVTYFDEPGVGTLGAGDILYSHVKLAKSLKWVTAYVVYENYTTMPESGFQGGNLFTLGVSKAQPIFGGHATLSGSLAVVYDDGGFGQDNGFLMKGSAELGWKLTSKLTLILPSVNYYAPLTVRDSRELDTVVSAGFSYRF